MIAGLDSSYNPPTAAQADAARAAGVRLWSGYLALPGGGRGLLAPWTRAEFLTAGRCGGAPIGFCSGWDDPAAIRALALDWGVRPCLDVEAGIRDLGDWTQPWLDASRAGVYGRFDVHQLRAAFHVLAFQPGIDPGATWTAARPADGTPVGWQWAGSHQEFGAQVDRGWYDDWFATGGLMGLDASFWTGIAQITLMAMHNQGYPKVDPGGAAVSSLAATLQDRYVNGNSAQPGLNAILDGWLGVGGTSQPIVQDVEVNVAAHVAQLEDRPPVAPAVAALLTDLAAAAAQEAKDLAQLAGDVPPPPSPS